MGRVRETLHDVLRQTDAVLLALCVASTLYGMVLIASATSFRGTLKYVAVQGLGLLIGLVLYLFLSSIDVFELAKQWKWLLGFNVGFLLLLLTPFGQTRNGNRAWLGVNDIGKNLGVGFLRNFPVTVQPAEVVKIFFIVLLAYQLALLKDRRDLVRFENVIQPTAHTAFMVGLIVVISGDAGSALVYLFIFICMVFAAGMAKRWLALGIGGGAAAFLAVWHLDLLPGYMRDRFLAVLDHSYQPDDAGFQQTRGLMALGSGELTGQGLFHGAQTQSSNVWSIPERQTDFIDIVAWRSTAEFVSKYFTKGSMAAVVDTVLAKNANARICIAAIALESLSAAIAALTAHGLSAEVTQLAVSRTRPAGRLHLLTANNPIFLITGERK